MNYKALIVESGKRMKDSGMTVETWGNISCRDSQTDHVYLTPSGMQYDTITEDDIVVCDLDGNVIDGKREPTIEKGLHLSVYKERPEINAVIHTHPIYSMVFGCTGEIIPLIIDEAAQLMADECRVAEYALPGSDELAQNCVKALGDKAMTCLLQSHGAVCLGKDMEQAFKVAKVLEVTAEIYYLIKSVGKTPIPISKENIEAMHYFATNVYGKKNA